MSNDLIHNLLNTVNSSDLFDKNLEKCFDYIQPECINIQNTSETFVYFPIRNAIRFLASKFDSFWVFFTKIFHQKTLFYFWTV